MKPAALARAGVPLLLATVASCASSPEQGAHRAESSPPPPPSSSVTSVLSVKPTAQRMTLLHVADSESELLAAERDDERARPHGGIARAVALMRALAARAKEPTLVVAAGDTWIPSPLLHVEVGGKNAVSASNNLLGLDASAIGNHEWDLGEAFLAEQLAASSFPYLSATLDAEQGPLAKHVKSEAELARMGPWAEESAGLLLPRARVCLGELAPAGDDAAALARCHGLVVGVVGATTELLRTISNVPEHVGVAGSLGEVRARVQAHVDALTREGVEIVVVLSHLQDARKELLLVAEGLVGVDIIVAGGGDDRLADARHRLLKGDAPDELCAETPDECYPLVRKSVDGKPVLVVATDGQLRYVGALSVSFDDEGVLTGYAAASRPWPVDEESLLELRADPAADAVAFEAALSEQLAPKSAPFAHSDVFLEGRRDEVRNRETNLGDLSADALMWAAERHAPEGWRPHLALRNGGGIRAPIGRFDHASYAPLGGPLRPIDVEGALKFDGGVVLVRVTHRQLKDALEAALRGAGTSRGQFPQVSRELYLEYTVHAPEQTQLVDEGRVTGLDCAGARVRTLKVQSAAGEIVVVEEGRLPTPDALLEVATLAFLAKGGDGWFPTAAGKVEQAALSHGGGDVTEQWSLRAYIEHLESRGEWNRGKGYPDPTPGKRETFTRLVELDDAVDVAEHERCTRVGAR